MTRLSFIIPTLGRPSLKRAVVSALASSDEGDEIIVVGDGPQPKARAIMAGLDSPRLRYMETRSTRKWGCAQYDFGIKEAAGDFLMFGTDDDVTPLDAFEYVRLSVGGKLWPHVFAMEHTGKKLGGSVKRCEVGAQQIVLPNIRYMIPSWQKYENSDTNDYEFLTEALTLWQLRKDRFEELDFPVPEFHDGIISVMQKHNFGRVF